MPTSRSKKNAKLAEQQKVATEKEGRIQEALQALNSQTFKTLSEAARHFKVLHFTLHCQHKKHNGLLLESQEENHLLTTAQEQTLVEWIKHMAVIGEPFSKQAIRGKVVDLSEILQEKTKSTGEVHVPSKNWIYAFLDHHPNLSLKWPTGLDSVHACNFNPNVVGRHFQTLVNF